jgi:hypothetical protein
MPSGGLSDGLEDGLANKAGDAPVEFVQVHSLDPRLDLTVPAVQLLDGLPASRLLGSVGTVRFAKSGRVGAAWPAGTASNSYN